MLAWETQRPWACRWSRGVDDVARALRVDVDVGAASGLAGEVGRRVVELQDRTRQLAGHVPERGRRDQGAEPGVLGDEGQPVRRERGVQTARTPLPPSSRRAGRRRFLGPAARIPTGIRRLPLARAAGALTGWPGGPARVGEVHGSHLHGTRPGVPVADCLEALRQAPHRPKFHHKCGKEALVAAPSGARSGVVHGESTLETPRIVGLRRQQPTGPGPPRGAAPAMIDGGARQGEQVVQQPDRGADPPGWDWKDTQPGAVVTRCGSIPSRSRASSARAATSGLRSSPRPTTVTVPNSSRTATSAPAAASTATTSVSASPGAVNRTSPPWRSTVPTALPRSRQRGDDRRG